MIQINRERKPELKLLRFKGDICHTVLNLLALDRTSVKCSRNQKKNRNECSSEDKITMKHQV